MRNTKTYEEVIAFVRDLYGQPDAFLPLHEPRFRGNEKKLVSDCIESTFVSSVGRYVDQFEEEVAKYVGSRYAVAMVNGTSALQLALKEAKAVQGDLVITQSATFVATVNAIVYNGAEPCFVDIEEETLGMSPDALTRFLDERTILDDGVCKEKESGKRVAACVPMHTFGYPCRIEEIADVCEQYGITLIEDSAESLGSWVGKTHTGRFGEMGVFSFNGNKILTTGGGGLVVTDNEAVAKHLKHLSTTAKTPHPYEFVHDEIGYNFRMPNLNAALGCAQLESLPEYLEKKREIHSAYSQFFESGSWRLVGEREGTRANHWLNAIVLESRDERDAFLEETNGKGVMTRPLWTPMHRLEMFSSAPKGDLSVTEDMANRVVNLTSSVP